MFTKLKQTFIGRPLKSLIEGEGGTTGKSTDLDHLVKRRSVLHRLWALASSPNIPVYL